MRYNICGIARKFRLQFKIFLLIGILLVCAVATWAAAPPDMKGYFVHFHMETLGNKPDDYLAQVGLEIGELITNRFGELLDVEPQGKLTTTWGNIKSIR